MEMDVETVKAILKKNNQTNKQIDYNFPWSFLDHRNDVKMFIKLCSEKLPCG